MTTEVGTDLYQRTIAYDYGDTERNELMRKVWTTTPWMVDTYTGSTDEDRYREMKDWCRENIGPECWPIHGKPGLWQTGGATIFGWTWFGFATEGLMQKFLGRWPNPPKNGSEKGNDD